MAINRVTGAALAAALMVAGGPDVRAARTNADVVLEWNKVLESTLPTNIFLIPRAYALMHVAMFDAVNAIEGDYRQYHVQLRHASGSSEAAAARAAHDVLSALNPGAKPVYDAALAARFGRRPSGFERRGFDVGALVAENILGWRQNDGWVAAAPSPYTPPPLPGWWQPTAPNFPNAGFTHIPNAAPLAVLTATQFLPPPPPMLNSEIYARDLNEVKALGRAVGSTRTPEQTEIARVWAGVGASGAPGGTTTAHVSIWNNIVRDLVVERGLSLVDSARLFALLNVSLNDAVLTTQASKFVYGLWRPVTAIRQADTDLNPATDPDPDWLPLLVTPPYPSYAGNLAGLGASAATVLRLALGADDIPVSATWRQSDGSSITHHFQGFWEVAEEEAMSRVYGGIHFQFDTVAGQAVGKRVAEFVYANYMQPRGKAYQ
jgi:hypothetical protein